MTPALENVRRLMEWGGGDCGAEPASAAPPIESVGILGAGMMGTAIAAAHVKHRLPVVISDSNEAALAGAAGSIAAELSATAGSRPQDAFRLVRVSTDPAEAARCDLVLESIVESLPAKQRLYAQLRGHLADHAIVASNTSTIPIRQLAAGVEDASRFCGMHFFHPVRRRMLVEIVRGPDASDRTIAAAAAHVRRIGRIPIVVRDGPGFLVNRLLFPYLGEALELLREGVRAEAIERAATEFGMAIGPLRLIDEIGLDTTLQAGWVLAAAFPERIVSSPLLVSMVKAGRLGQKSGAGFYAYDGPAGEAAADALDPAAEEIITRWIDAPRGLPCDSLACRLVPPMLLEATRVLEEGGVRDVFDIDRAALFGLGFPAEKGGLLWWADALGPDRVVAMLSSRRAPGERGLPTPMLLTMAKTGGRFYSPDDL